MKVPANPFLALENTNAITTHKSFLKPVKKKDKNQKTEKNQNRKRKLKRPEKVEEGMFHDSEPKKIEIYRFKSTNTFFCESCGIEN